MPIDSSIALQVRPFQMEAPANQLMRLMQMQHMQQQGDLADVQVQQQRQALEDDRAIRQALQGVQPGEGYLPSVVNKLQTVGNPAALKQAQALQAAEVERQLKAAQTFKDTKQGEHFGVQSERDRASMVADELKRGSQALLANPDRQAAVSLVTGMAKKYGGDPSGDVAFLSQATPEQVQKWAMAHAGMADKLLAQVEMKDAGGSIVPTQVNPYAAMPLGQVAGAPLVRKTITPDAAARLAQEKELAGQAVTYQQDGNGNIVALPSKVAPGTLVRASQVAAPGAGLQPLQGKPSEKVQTEQLEINQQRAMIDGAIDAVKKTPGAFSMSRGAATLAGAIPESIAGRMDTDDERQARAFVFNNVSAVIKERAGTAQSKQELARLRAFLPAETDSAEQIVSKFEGYKRYLAEKEKGTTTRKPDDSAPKPSGNAAAGFTIIKVE